MKKRKEMADIIALIIIIGSFSYLIMLLFIKVPKENETMINVITGGVILGGIGAVIGYYFGSSKTASQDIDFNAPNEISLGKNDPATNDNRPIDVDAD